MNDETFNDPPPAESQRSALEPQSLRREPMQSIPLVLSVGIEAVKGGLAVFFLSEAKTPLKGSHAFYDAVRTEAELVALYHRYRGATYIAYATGSENKHPDHGIVPASGVAVLDLDFKHPEAVEWYEANKHRLPDTFTYRTRSGGLHLVYQDHPKLRTVAGNIETGVDVKARGGYACAWFLHGYEVLLSGEPASWPDWLDIPNTKASTRRKRATEATARPRQRAVTPRRISQQAVPLAGTVAAAIKGGLDTRMERPIGIGEGERDDTLFRWACSCFARGMTFDETLNDCLDCNATFDPPLDEDQVVKCVNSGWRKESAKQAAADGTNAEIPDDRNDNSSTADPEARPQPSDAWKARAIRDDRWNMIPNVTNVMLALEHVFPTRFTYDQFACGVKIDRECPIEEADVIELQSWLQKQGLKRVGKDCVHDAVQARARANAYHPLREEIESTPWDGIKRIEKFAVTHLGCDDTAYNTGIACMFLISMVARVFDPGCQCDHMVIFEGPQGILKSSALRALASEKYFSDQLPDLSHKDSSQHLRDKWLLEISEMHTFDKADTNKLKAYVTRRVERYRPPYGRVEVTEPRQCVFAGTMNPIGGAGYLRDPTGGRRFWGLEVATIKPIDIRAIKNERGQLFAEALKRFKDGWSWWPSAEFERTHIVPEQDARVEDDVWREKISEWLDVLIPCGTCDSCQQTPSPGKPKPACKKPQPRTAVTISEVAKEALGIGAYSTGGPEQKLSRADQNRIMACMTQLKWVRGVRHNHARWWTRKPDGDRSRTE